VVSLKKILKRVWQKVGIDAHQLKVQVKDFGMFWVVGNLKL
jgi:hypothetical protein